MLAALTASLVVEYVVGAKPKRRPPVISTFSTGLVLPMPTSPVFIILILSEPAVVKIMAWVELALRSPTARMVKAPEAAISAEPMVMVEPMVVVPT